MAEHLSRRTKIGFGIGDLGGYPISREYYQRMIRRAAAEGAS